MAAISILEKPGLLTSKVMFKWLWVQEKTQTVKDKSMLVCMNCFHQLASAFHSSQEITLKQILIDPFDKEFERSDWFICNFSKSTHMRRVDQKRAEEILSLVSTKAPLQLGIRACFLQSASETHLLVIREMKNRNLFYHFNPTGNERTKFRAYLKIASDECEIISHLQYEKPTDWDSEEAIEASEKISSAIPLEKLLEKFRI